MLQLWPIRNCGCFIDAPISGDEFLKAASLARKESTSWPTVSTSMFLFVESHDRSHNHHVASCRHEFWDNYVLMRGSRLPGIYSSQVYTRCITQVQFTRGRRAKDKRTLDIIVSKRLLVLWYVVHRSNKISCPYFQETGTWSAYRQRSKFIASDNNAASWWHNRRIFSREQKWYKIGSIQSLCSLTSLMVHVWPDVILPQPLLMYSCAGFRHFRQSIDIYRCVSRVNLLQPFIALFIHIDATVTGVLQLVCREVWWAQRRVFVMRQVIRSSPATCNK